MNPIDRSDAPFVPDPLRFTLEGLRQRGALVDPDAGLAVLPEDLRRDLALPEEILLQTAPAPGGKQAPGAARVPCGIGSPLLSRLAADARGVAALCWSRLLLDAPRPAHAAALGERFVVRNGVCELLDLFPAHSLYVLLGAAYVAEADERHEGVVSVAVHAADGAEPDPALARLLSPAHNLSGLGPQAPLTGADEAAPWLAVRAEAQLRAALAPVHDGLLRRHARDHARISAYFAALIDETRRPRRRVDASAVAAKLAHLVGERDTKLLDLTARFTLRVSVQPAALCCVVVPVVRLRLRARRRKESRELVTRLPAGATALDRLACDGCAGTTARPLLCDDSLHVLCERCERSATGRPHCPACRPRRPRPPAPSPSALP